MEDTPDRTPVDRVLYTEPVRTYTSLIGGELFPAYLAKIIHDSATALSQEVPGVDFELVRMHLARTMASSARAYEQVVAGQVKAAGCTQADIARATDRDPSTIKRVYPNLDEIVEHLYYPGFINLVERELLEIDPTVGADEERIEAEKKRRESRS